MVTSNSINLPRIKLGCDKDINDRMCIISQDKYYKADVTLTGDTDVQTSPTIDKKKCQGIMEKVLMF